MNLLKKLIEYIKNSRLELKKVIWPSRQTTMLHTIMVIGVSLAVAVFLGSIDFIFNQVLDLVLQ